MDNTTVNLNSILPAAQQGGYAVGSFSARLLPVIPVILQAGQRLRSPLIVQVAQVELSRYQVEVEDFAAAFFRSLQEQEISVPVALHLDHNQDFGLIERAIAAGFTSVMIDASAEPLEENIRRTRQVVEYAHPRGVTVEAELGRLSSVDGLESGRDDEMYTLPEEAAMFGERTGVDALAVSVGTIHGVYQVRQPRIDLERLEAIRRATCVPLVLHGGSGNPAEMIHAAIRIPGGGVSKINIATDLENALLAALGQEKRLLNRELEALPEERKEQALGAVEAVVEDKMVNFLMSAGRA